MKRQQYLAYPAPAGLPSDRGVRNERLKEEVATLWARGHGRVRIRRELERRYGEGLVSDGTVGNWIRALRKPSPRTFTPEPWHPWEPELDPWARPSHLLTLDLLARTVLQRGLYRHEARYASRLEYDLLQVQDPFAQLFLVVEYGMREEDKVTKGLEQIYTGDLDALVVLKPWTKEGRGHYMRGLEAGAVPFPMIGWLMVPPEHRSHTGLQALAMRGCRGLGLPFDLVVGGREGEPPEPYSLIGPDDPKETEMIDLDWRELLLRYWEHRKAEQGDE